MTSILPLLVIFDTDFTLWPFRTRDHWPFGKWNDEIVIDPTNRTLEYYPEVPQIFQYLKNISIKIAVICCDKSDHVDSLLTKFDLNKYISYKDISIDLVKTDHLINIQKQSNISFDKMIFFDDLKMNVDAGESLGIFSICQRNVTMEVLKVALKNYDLKQQAVSEEKEEGPKGPLYNFTGKITVETYNKFVIGS